MATIGHTMPQPMTTISHLLYMPTTLCVPCDVPQASQGFWESNFRCRREHAETRQNLRPLRLRGQDPSKPLPGTTGTLTKARASSGPPVPGQSPAPNRFLVR